VPQSWSERLRKTLPHRDSTEELPARSELQYLLNYTDLPGNNKIFNEQKFGRAVEIVDFGPIPDKILIQIFDTRNL
jgi:hypothetical protein